MLRVLAILTLLLIGPVAIAAASYGLSGPQPHWRDADRSPAGLAPDPAAAREAIVQIYAARAYRWRGIFADHTWIALKREGATAWTRYDVMGWGTPLKVNRGAPDGRWVGAVPQLVYELRGPEASRIIPGIEAAVASYPYGAPGGYTLWPGPNSNSFVAAIARAVDGFDPHLPPRAVGKDYGSGWLAVMRTPSKTGWQISLGGYAGIGIAAVEGIELHVLGSTLGLDVLRPAVKMPGLGRIGMPAAAG